MQSSKQLLLLLAGTCASFSAQAVGPTATAEFSIRDPVTYRKTRTLQARLDQYICLSIHARLVPDGEHSLQLTIYDGLGAEIRKLVSREIVSGALLEKGFCHGFDEDHDAAGTWWYVVELNGEPLVSTSFEVRGL